VAPPLEPLGENGEALSGVECTAALDCAPAKEECFESVCSDDQTCSVTRTYPGKPCNNGIGVCNDFGTCDMPMCRYKSVVATPFECSSVDDCNDNSPCTEDACVNGYCRHSPLADGVACLPGALCNRGACCVPLR
jgi:hypothetical protein